MSTLNPYFYAYNPELLAFENAWIQFVKFGDQNEIFIRSVIKEEVYASWQRCKEIGLDPLSLKKTPLLSAAELNERLTENRNILHVVDPFLNNLYSMIKNSGFRVDFIDTDGYILRSLGDEETLEVCEKTNSFPGANRCENLVGTNSSGLALITGLPVQVAGAEHYCQLYQRWACSSAPIIGPNGEILGVLTASGMYELIHIHTLGMISSMAKAIGDELHIQQINEQLAESNSQLRSTLETVTDGVVYVEKGYIMQANQEMCFLLGKDVEEIIGQKMIESVRTIPVLSEILNDKANYRESEIVLKGEKRNFKCLFGFRGVFGKNSQEVGKVIIFTRVEEIQNLASKIKYSPRYTFKDIVGQAPSIKAAIELAKKASEYDSRVIIEGDSGTGKEMFSQAIHNNSIRQYGPFVAIDCGSIPRELLESELFGYVGGAFTGAKKEGKAGLFEIANKGTIFLDEIGNMPMNMQVKLLRVLQEGVFTRVGGTDPIHSDVRVIAATNGNLKKSIESGSFREDLFYRLNVFHIRLPSLKDRLEDIPLLVDHYLGQNKIHKGHVGIEKAAIHALQTYDWPGNIRQLQNIIERGLIMSNFKMIRKEDLSGEVLGKDIMENHNHNAIPLEQKMSEYVLQVLALQDGNITKTAKLLGISRSKVYKVIAAAGKQEGFLNEL